MLDLKSILELGCPKKILSLLNKLNHPRTIQDYMKNKLEYNHRDDTNRSFLGVVEAKAADCFEGSVSFAYVLLYLWGYDPRIVLIHAVNDVDHTLVVYKRYDKLGSVAMSRQKELMDRPAVFSNLKDLVLDYYPHYTSIYPKYAGQLTMRGFSDPINLVKKFGIGWFFLPGNNAIEYLYKHIADNLTCTNIFTGKRYPYPPEYEY